MRYSLILAYYSISHTIYECLIFYHPDHISKNSGVSFKIVM